jgi:hypothetical protein
VSGQPISFTWLPLQGHMRGRIVRNSHEISSSRFFISFSLIILPSHAIGGRVSWFDNPTRLNDAPLLKPSNSSCPVDHRFSLTKSSAIESSQWSATWGDFPYALEWETGVLYSRPSGDALRTSATSECLTFHTVGILILDALLLRSSPSLRPLIPDSLTPKSRVVTLNCPTTPC